MATLYELTEDFQLVLQMAEDPDIDPEVIKDTLEGIEGAIEDKADGYSKVLASILSEINTIKAEEVRLQKRRKHLESRYTLLKDNLKASLEACGKYKFKTALFSYNIRNNPAHVVLDCEVLDLPKELIKYAAPQADLAGIKSILDGGAEFPFAHLEQSKSLVIR